MDQHRHRIYLSQTHRWAEGGKHTRISRWEEGGRRKGTLTRAGEGLNVSHPGTVALNVGKVPRYIEYVSHSGTRQVACFINSLLISAESFLPFLFRREQYLGYSS